MKTSDFYYDLPQELIAQTPLERRDEMCIRDRKKTAGIAAQVTASAADTAVSKTRTMASIGRVKLAISSEEDKLKKAYTELGRLFYRDYQAQAEADMTEYQPWCDRAADAREQIQRLTKELETLKAEGKDTVKDTVKDAPKAQEEVKPEEVEDTSIFADMDDEPEVEIEIKVESKPEEQPKETDAPETAPETAEEPEACLLYTSTRRRGGENGAPRRTGG